MNISKIFLLSFVLFFACGLVSAQETDTTETIAFDEDVTAEDFNVSEPNLLPDNPFYFFKTWGREIRAAFTFNPIKKVELRERFSNEKLMELKKMAEKNRNANAIRNAARNYQDEIEKMKKETEKIKETAGENEQIGKFLDKFIQQQALHQRVLQRLENQVPKEAFEKISEAREKHLEKFCEVMVKLEDKKERLQERLENNLKKVKGGEFKEFKNIEILKELEEKAPEAAREAIQNVRANSLIRLKEKIEGLSSVKMKQFQSYTERIAGTKEKQVEILDTLKEELKAKPLIRQKLIETRDNVMEEIRIRAEKINCPQLEKPSTDFCPDGRIIVRKNDKGCVIGFSCIKPETTSNTSACITLWDPVCGDNGKTYSNKCFAELAEVDIEYKGVCKEKSAEIQIQRRLR